MIYRVLRLPVIIAAQVSVADSVKVKEKVNDPCVDETPFRSVYCCSCTMYINRDFVYTLKVDRMIDA
jgi:hypothetical protein